MQWWGLRTKSVAAYHPWQWRTGVFVLESIIHSGSNNRHNKHRAHTNTHTWKASDLPIVETTVPAKKKELLKSQLLSSICDSFPTGYTPFWMASVRFWERKQNLVSTWLLFSSACCKATTDLENYCSFPVNTTHLSSAILWHYSYLYLQGWVAASWWFQVLVFCPVYTDYCSGCQENLFLSAWWRTSILLV